MTTPNITKLSQIDSISCLEEIIGHSINTLNIILKNPYQKKQIPKKSGGTRTIYQPSLALKIIQQKLLPIFMSTYDVRPSVHGFVTGKNIKTNALVHSGRKAILNLDLKDFFLQIKFSRLMGILQHSPNNLDPVIAKIIARICCFDNHTPMGAPTSPIISNMICFKMDGLLQKFAKENNCVYTRYCDDITFSTWTNNFRKNVINISDPLTLGTQLTEIIKSSGFEINTAKTSLRHFNYRQYATGLTINQFPNIRRSYIKNTKAMLHNFNKDEFQALNNFKQKHFTKYNHISDHTILYQIFRKCLLGRINYIGFVRGLNDPIFNKLMIKYYEKFDQSKIQKHKNKLDILTNLTNAVWVVEVFCDDYCGQGTAFYLKDVGLVSCNHVINPSGINANASKDITAYQATNPSKIVNLKIKNQLLQNEAWPDLIILEGADDEDNETISRNHLTRSATPPKITDIVFTLGYPNHAPGSSINIDKGIITQLKTRSLTKYFSISSFIMSGKSGGPVLNEKHEVIGVITYGVGGDKNNPEENPYGNDVTEIQEIDKITQNVSNTEPNP